MLADGGCIGTDALEDDDRGFAARGGVEDFDELLEELDDLLE